jgi:hypothetical protein
MLPPLPLFSNYRIKASSLQLVMDLEFRDHIRLIRTSTSSSRPGNRTPRRHKVDGQNA